MPQFAFRKVILAADVQWGFVIFRGKIGQCFNLREGGGGPQRKYCEEEAREETVPFAKSNNTFSIRKEKGIPQREPVRTKEVTTSIFPSTRSGKYTVRGVGVGERGRFLLSFSLPASAPSPRCTNKKGSEAGPARQGIETDVRTTKAKKKRLYPPEVAVVPRK